MHGELVQTADRAFREQGTDFLDKMRGQKFRKMFTRFMSTLAHLKQEQDALQEQERPQPTDTSVVGAAPVISSELPADATVQSVADEV